LISMITNQNILITNLVMFGLLLFFMRKANAGKIPQIRQIAAVDAIAEGIGRAAEQNRPVFFFPGSVALESSEMVQTLAALNVLSQVAQIAADKGAVLKCVAGHSTIFPLMEETLRQAFLTAGTPESYKSDTLLWFSDSAYARDAAVMGMMHRERFATNIIIGRCYVESMMYCETGNFLGALQIGGTAAAIQAPFFVTMCDYALIGDEIYAAGASLSKDPVQLGSIEAQDIGKAIAIVLIIIGTVLLSLGIRFSL